MAEIQKQVIPVFLSEDGEPIAFIHYDSGTRAREIYVCERASEDQMIEIYENKETKK